MPTSLSDQIQSFYDASSGLWESIWGEHMHHGYYGPTGTVRKDRRQAQIDLIDECLRWANVTQAAEILDCGCGIGGSALELATRFNAKVTGITLSPVQANRATERAEATGLAGNTAPCAQFQVANALQTPFADESFDFIWSMESGEHMPNKAGFLQECHRILKPGGKLLMVDLVPSTHEFPGRAADARRTGPTGLDLSGLWPALRAVFAGISDPGRTCGISAGANRRLVSGRSPLLG
jgi:tocopherol O-methyltransferase